MARLRMEHVMIARGTGRRCIDAAVSPETQSDGDRSTAVRASVIDACQARIGAALTRFADPRVGRDAVNRAEPSVVHGVLRRECGFSGTRIHIVSATRCTMSAVTWGTLGFHPPPRERLP